jgi:eukaryotic-like serine/threonine-protein kinase
MSTQKPHTIGPYEILGPLAQGGMGVLYRGWHARTHEPVAIKTVQVPDERLVQGIRREIAALARIRHPGVVRIVDEGFEDGLPWYAMELLDGRSLRLWKLRLWRGPEGAEPPRIFGETRTQPSAALRAVLAAPELRPRPDVTLPRPTEPVLPHAAAPCADFGGAARAPRQRLPAAGGQLRRVLTLVRRLCETLAYLHGEGIVHGDLKPDNVQVQTDGVPVLVDFGVVSRFWNGVSREALDVAGAVGTLAYMAPEQIRGELIDARADLYALGCILFELLTAEPVFGGTTDEQVLQQQLERRPEPPSSRVEGIPPGLDELVLRLLAKRPRDRLGYAVDVAAALVRLGAEPELVAPELQPRPYPYRAGFAGRSGTQQQLEAWLGELRGGRGGLVLVSGEGGVGKTRLALQLARAARTSGVQVLTGDCPPGGLAEPGAAASGAEPLHALRRPLRELADRCRAQGPETSRRLLGRHAPALAPFEPAFARMPGLEADVELPELPPDLARLRLYRALAESFAALAEEQPLLLILDDLQWADGLSVGWLEHLLHTGLASEARLLIVGLYRGEEAGEVLCRLADGPGVRHLELGRLGDEAVAAIVGDMLALEAVPELFCGYLSRCSGGNPFFVAEYLRAALDERLLWRDEQGQWHVAEPSGEDATTADYEQLGLPSSLRGLIERRLQRLPAAAAQAAAAAAVLGRESGTRELAQVAGLGELELGAAVQELLRSGVLEESCPGRLRFAHDGTRQVAYEGLPLGRRREMHAAAAAALGASDTLVPAAELALHLEEAGEWPSARSAWLRAARHARTRHAPAEAGLLYRRYLDLVDEPGHESVQARSELAMDVLYIRGRIAEAVHEQELAIAEARALGESRLEGTLTRGLSAIHGNSGHVDEARRHLESALGILREAGAGREEAVALSNLAILHQRQGQIEQARELFEQALALHREHDDLHAEGVTLGNFAVLHSMQGRIEPARLLYERALELHRSLGERRWEGIVLVNLATLLGSSGSLTQALPLLSEALGILREVGDLRWEGVALVNLGRLEHDRGRLDEALSLLGQAEAIHRGSDNRRNLAVSWRELGRLHRELGRHSRAEALLAQALGVHRELGDRRAEGIALGELGILRQAEGRPDEAAGLLEQALARHREIGNPALEGAVLVRLAAIERLCRGDAAGAEALADRAAGLLHEARDLWHLALCRCELGHVALARERPARAHLEQALAAAEALGLFPESAVARALARLERAVAAAGQGAAGRLFRGELREDVPPALRSWLLAAGQWVEAREEQEDACSGS